MASQSGKNKKVDYDPPRLVRHTRHFHQCLQNRNLTTRAIRNQELNTFCPNCHETKKFNRENGKLLQTYHFDDLYIGFNPKLINKCLEISCHLNAVILHFCWFVTEKILSFAYLRFNTSFAHFVHS